MLNVFFTVDVEIWCGSWRDLDASFPRAFREYVYGRTRQGEYGLRYMLGQLREHGLHAVFFVEPLFATRFGLDPLAEIVGLIREYGQEVQLHLHTEWVCESRLPLIERAHPRRQFMRDFSLEEQTVLIGAGAALIARAQGGAVKAFRAGSFGCNLDTLHALAAQAIAVDSSYNASMLGPGSGILPGQILVEPSACAGVMEYPMTVFKDGTRRLRHAQLGACSAREMEGLLWQALQDGRQAFVMLAHNFELLNVARDRPDKVMLQRFRALCRLLERNRDSFITRGFAALERPAEQAPREPLVSSLRLTGHRMVEQIMRRAYG